MARKIIGVTGGMGTGKSTVARMFRQAAGDAVIFDADKMARRFLKKGSDSAKMVAQFFPGAVDKKGSIDTKKLADAVFRSQPKLSLLNRLIHPLVVKAARQKLGAVKAKYVILDVPLLVEADMLGIVDAAIIVDAEKKAVTKRSKFQKKEIERRSAHQTPFEKKKEEAVKKLGQQNVFVVDNSGSRKQTKEQVKEIWERLK